MIKSFLLLLIWCFVLGKSGYCDIYPELNLSKEAENFSKVYDDVKAKKDKDFTTIYQDNKNKRDRKNTNYLDAVNVSDPKSIEEAYILNQKYEDLSQSIYSFSIYSSSLFSPIENSLFEKIFKSDNSSGYGPFYIEYDTSFGDEKKVGGLGYHFGFGFGYFQGFARTVGTNIETKTRLTLWFIPVDLGLTYRASLTNSVGVKLSAGVTGSGMIQSRSDFRDNESGKNSNRIGQGYFALGRMDFRLGDIMLETRKNFYHNYGFSNFRLNLDFKYQFISFNGDGKELDFSGTSLGVGVSFDVL